MPPLGAVGIFQSKSNYFLTDKEIASGKPETISDFSPSSILIFAGYIVYRDYDDILQQAGNSPSSPYVHHILNDSPYEGMRSGDYSFTISYRLPDGTVTTSKSIKFIY